MIMSYWPGFANMPCARWGGRLSLTVNLPRTHSRLLAYHSEVESITYALGFQMRATQAMVVLVEIHHLKSIELVGYFLDLLLLPWLDDFHAFCIPS
jgi:hypothetical protein